MAGDLDRDTMERAYARWAPIYDAVCGPVFEKGRRAATAAAKQAGRRILEVGVGTGLSFQDYDARHEVYGIDLSEPMIARARERMASGAFPHVKEVNVMDAHHLAYPDAMFDAVVAQFVITLVERPERVLDECARVLKPGGEIILVNHLYSERGLAAAVERWFAKHAHTFGLRPEFPFQRLQAWAEAHGGVEVAERRRVALLGVYTLVRFRKLAEGDRAATRFAAAG
ncbi:class I SAM-dependent methyltransferase [Phreatobacter cathodiphilus]|uniref:SAM-dependent methyltransferase n=1 Tax=Phreatobacter cathodiphilus TaxID=1868589 RepID=A0A2S0NCS4_9HYPH|nr:class I SAM-dependent methyltransferase [Phreatobacter cathodiphilus]AVO45731.1 SAM-dependent methyltransferase [Phreatobacter cathodiphilus]